MYEVGDGNMQQWLIVFCHRASAGRAVDPASGGCTRPFGFVIIIMISVIIMVIIIILELRASPDPAVGPHRAR